MPVENRAARTVPLIGRLTVSASLLGVASGAYAAIPLTAPLAPEGTARSLALGSAVVARGGDMGALAVNPATLNDIGQESGDDVTAGTGDRGPYFFLGHAYGQSGDQIPGALWGADLNSSLAGELLVNYTVGASTKSGFDGGATLRYERWTRGGETQGTVNADGTLNAEGTSNAGASLNGDIGGRYAIVPELHLGLSILNIMHPDPFAGEPNSTPTETEAVGGIGYTAIGGAMSGAGAEIDYVYTKDHRYARFGAEVPIAQAFWVRGGIDDKNYSAGLGYVHGGTSISLTTQFIEHAATLYLIGLSNHF